MKGGGYHLSWPSMGRHAQVIVYIIICNFLLLSGRVQEISVENSQGYIRWVYDGPIYDKCAGFLHTEPITEQWETASVAREIGKVYYVMLNTIN